MLSTSVVFLVAGMVLGRGVLDWVHIESGTEVMARFSELSLFVILFVDGAQLELRELREWPGASPGRALLLGMPLLRVDWLFWSGRF